MLDTLKQLAADPNDMVIATFLNEGENRFRLTLSTASGSAQGAEPLELSGTLEEIEATLPHLHEYTSSVKDAISALRASVAANHTKANLARTKSKTPASSAPEQSTDKPANSEHGVQPTTTAPKSSLFD